MVLPKYYEWKLLKPQRHTSDRDSNRGFCVSNPCLVCTRTTGNIAILEMIPANRIMTDQLLLEVSMA